MSEKTDLELAQQAEADLGALMAVRAFMEGEQFRERGSMCWLPDFDWENVPVRLRNDPSAAEVTYTQVSASLRVHNKGIRWEGLGASFREALVDLCGRLKRARVALGTMLLRGEPVDPDEMHTLRKELSGGT